LGYRLLDTGALYRSVALAAEQREIAWTDEAALAALAAGLDVRFELDGDLNRVFLGEREVTEAIRAPRMSKGASVVSALPGVRRGLLDLQRRLASGGGVVAEGRDMGTVVFPHAQAKFFLTASAQVRAHRRHRELERRGHAQPYREVLAQMQARDERDSTRAVAPLVPAEDAMVVDSTDLAIDDVVQAMYEVVRGQERAESAD